MGYDLTARNKEADSFHMGAFSWPWMLEAGVGLPLCHGKGIEPAQFIYRGRPDGKSVGYNDNARVTAKEARQMAQVARWLADYQDMLHEQWMREPEDARERMSNAIGGLYNLPVRRDFVAKVRAFADWAEKSGGFVVG